MSSEIVSKPPAPSQVGQDLHHPNCFACGVENPTTLHISSNFDEKSGEVKFIHILDENQEGAPGHSHGGVLATLLDEAQGVLCHHLGHFVMTDNFYLKYHKATPLNTPLKVRAWLTSVRRRRLYTRGTIHLESGELLVEAKIRWYMIPDKILIRKFDVKSKTDNLPRMAQVLELNRNRNRELRHSLRKKK